jgi:MYXO-CTERM domain-containing protein
MLVALLLVHTAAANPKYPAIVFNELGLEVAPQCTLCHRDLNGGRGTVEKPFGLDAMDHGLTGTNGADELPGILDDMEADGTDGDKDGVGDIEELKEGTDPNVAGSTLSPPKYGCLSTTSGTAPAPILAFAALILVRRRRQ